MLFLQIKIVKVDVPLVVSNGRHIDNSTGCAGLQLLQLEICQKESCEIVGCESILVTVRSYMTSLVEESSIVNEHVKLRIFFLVAAPTLATIDLQVTDPLSCSRTL